LTQFEFLINSLHLICSICYIYENLKNDQLENTIKMTCLNYSQALSLLLFLQAAIDNLPASSGHPPLTSRDLENIIEDTNRVETAHPGITLSGYVDVGYIYNLTDDNTRVPNTQGYSADSGIEGDFSVNQIKLALEKPLTGDISTFEAGFRIDLMFGEDAAGFGVGPLDPIRTTSFYFQQAYINMNLPVGNGIELIAGQFNPFLGFEADERVDNLNITQGLNASVDPGPAAGVLASYAINDCLSLTQAIINGSGASSNAGLDADSDGYALTGAIALANPTGNAETQWAYHYAPMGDAGIGAGQTENEPLLGLNWVGTWAPLMFDDKLLLGFNASLWQGLDYTPDDSSTIITTSWYTRYQWTDLISTASRFEYTHNDDSQFTGFQPDGSDDVWGWTGTLGFHFIDDLLIRCEYRIDWGNDVTTGINDDSIQTVAAQVVYSF